jgi:hypothetical protein
MSLIGSRLVAALATAALLAAGCAGPAYGIADRIRAANSPTVRDVVLWPANPFGGRPDEIRVYVVDGATEADALALWCNVMLPAGAAEMLPHIDVWRGRPGVERPALEDPTCPD